MKTSLSFVGIMLALLVINSHCQRLSNPCPQTKAQALDATTEASVTEDAFEGFTELSVLPAKVSSNPVTTVIVSG